MQSGAGRHCATREKRAGRNTVAAKKKKKKYRGFWIFVKVQFVLSLLVLGGLGYYVLGGYASEVSSIHKEADSLVRNSTEETFRKIGRASCRERV